jgi:hypothetical protein
MLQPPGEAITQPGDLWTLGKHRLLCGDSSKPADVDRLLDGAEVHLVLHGMFFFHRGDESGFVAMRAKNAPRR